MGNVTVEYDESLDICFFTVEGDVGYELLLGEIDKYYKVHLTRYTLWDFRNASLKLTTEELKKIAGYVIDRERKRPPGTGCVTTIVVSDLLKYGLARMFAALNEAVRNDGTTITTGVFRSKEEALSWIKIHHYNENQTNRRPGS